MPSTICNPTKSDRGSDNSDSGSLRTRPRLEQRGSLLSLAWLLIALVTSGCATSSQPNTVKLRELEIAPPYKPIQTQRQVVSNTAALRPLYHALGRRLGLIQIRSTDEWLQLALAAPNIGPCPNFQDGLIVGLVSSVGTSLDGGWPFHWSAVRMCRGAGLIEAEFNSGSYLPDGVTYLETAYVNDLSTVLVVNVDGINYFPE